MSTLPMNQEDHPAHDLPDATQQYAGDVLPLHPPGTFSRNTQGGDVINGVARTLGIAPPNNVVKFPAK